jgi:hypothetical protein
MKRPCMYEGCGERRVHHDRQDVKRGPQMHPFQGDKGL